MSQEKKQKSLRVVFMGTPEFAIPALDALNSAHQIVAVYTQPDRPVGRGLELRASAVKKRALELGLTIYQPEKLTLPGEFERLQELSPDIIVVVAYGQILKSNVLELPRLGCVNIHSSLLPRWRGAAPIHWAILNGDQKTGVTTMRLVEKLDAGDILLQKETPISEEDTISSLHDRLARFGGELILPTLDGLSNGQLMGRSQDSDQVTYAAKLTKEMEWLDPKNDSAEVLARKIRALNPWPGASVFLGQRLKIHAARVRNEIQGVPGVISEKVGMLLLGTSQGSLELLQMQWDGKKRIQPSEFLNGMKGRGQVLPLQVEVPSRHS